MKRFIFLLVIILLLAPQVSSVSSSLKSSYAPRETMIGELTGGILAPIHRDQIKVVKDGHLDVAVEYDVAKLGNKHFIWIIAPTNPGAYTLVIRDLVVLVNGAPEVIEYRKDFSVQGAMVDYSVSPGFILAEDDFEISAIAYTDSEVEIDFPEQRTILLYPGTNHIDFSIASVLGIRQLTINLGRYQIPAYIIGADYICGDGRIDDREVCDGENLNGTNCTNYGGGSPFVSGQLRCASGCLAFDTGLCNLPEEPPEPQEECSLENLNLCLNQTSCVNVGGYWYNNTCNRYEQGASCDSEHVELCVAQGACLDAGGYWYNNTCNENPAPVCNSQHLSLCLTHGTCLDAGGYWYNNMCNEEPEIILSCGDGIINGGEECDGLNLSSKNCSSLGFDFGNLSCVSKGFEKECRYDLAGCHLVPPPSPPSFVVYPALIKSKILLNEDLPIYQFSVSNQGLNVITGLRLDYNPSKFIINPNQEINIDINESVTFNVSVKDAWKGSPFRGVVIVYADDVYEYLLLDINFTESASDAITEYSRNSTATGPSYYCSELSGLSCGDEEVCEGNVVSTIDVAECCVGNCKSQSDSGGGRSWIGYLVAGIVLLAIVIIYMKYKKTGNPGVSPLQGKLMGMKKTIP